MRTKFTSILLILCFICNAQSAKEMLKEIEGKWKLDDSNNVTFVKILETPNVSKNEIFNRVSNYFAYKYTDGNSVIQTRDKDQGLVIGKGIYKNIHIGESIVQTYVSAWHIIRVDIQEGRARIIISLTAYDKIVMDGNALVSESTSTVSENYPINSEGGQKTVMSKAFYKSYQAVQNSFLAIEKAIKEGNTSTNIESEKW